MKRFTVAAALAVVLGLGLAGTADAQYIQQHYRITPYGGVAKTTQVYNFGAYQSANTFYSPSGAVIQSGYYNDVFGNRSGYSNGYNQWNGNNFNRGFYQPSPILYPYSGGYNYGSGYNYGFYRRW
jgi:hypothetical protein